MSKNKNKIKKFLNSYEGQSLDITNNAYFLVEQLGQGKTLDEVANERGVLFSDFMSEINEEPRLIQAVKDGKSKGKAYWQSKLKRIMMDNSSSASLVKLWFGNYMEWWDRPLPEEFEENAIVTVTVVEHKPKKKQRALIAENEELS